MNDSRDKPLAPTAFTPAAPASSSPQPTPSGHKTSWLLATALLVSVLAGVVFLLPGWIASEPPVGADKLANAAAVAGQSQSATRSTPPASAGNGSQADTTGSESPFAEAQAARERRAAQDLLQPLLALQEFLEARAVTLWAGDDYAAALATAEAGDEAYRNRDFASATQAYQRASRALAELEERLPQVVAADKAVLRESIEALAPTEAQHALDRLRQTAPEDPELLDLESRVAALPQVKNALAKADTLASNAEFAAAINEAAKAVAADKEHQKAAATLKALRAQRLQQRFTQAMTAGYAALDTGDFELAADRFSAASALLPGAREPVTAQAELESARTAAQLRRLRDSAQRFEEAEQWEEALTRYREALATDATLVFAREGVARTESRAEIVTAAEAVIAAPERLVERVVLQEAENTLARLQSLELDGPKYRQLVSELEATLERATTPVAVTLTSDGLTDVTIARVARLGRFEKQQVTLRPGQYTAVGIRNGYRDVRVEFEVALDDVTSPVSVRCNEAL